MRVLVASYTSLLQAHYRRKVDALAKLPGIEVEVLVPPAWRELWRRGADVALERDGTEPYRLNVGRALFTGNLHFAMFREQLLATLRRFRPDLIDLEDEPFNLGSLQMALARRAIRPAAVLVTHASQNVVKRYPPPFNLVERFVLKDAAAFLARTDDAAAVLRAKGVEAARVAVVPHGVDAATFAPPAPDERARRRERWKLTTFTVGFVGALTRQKGLETVLEAVERTPGVDVLLVGEGPHRAALVEEIGRRGLTGRVQLHPAVSHAGVAEVMGALDAFVLPSISLPGLAERFGRVLVEAMGCGVPVIGSSSGEIPRVLGEAGLVFAEGEAAPLAAILARLRDDPAECARLGAAGRRRVLEQFSWDVVARRTAEVYAAALDRSLRR